jgi:Asp-tRNA(Asn)/Glu-tRNA(Gln) amidotransferase A subunit family amidase
MSDYELKPLNLPRLTGTGLKLFTALVENPASRALLINTLLENAGIPKLRRMDFPDPPTFLPLVPPKSHISFSPDGFTPGTLPDHFPYKTAADYRSAYQTGALTPVDVANRVLDAIEASEHTEPALHCFMPIDRQDVLNQAQAATLRYQQGKPFGPLDGVPVAVKDEIDMLPYPTSVGTTFLGSRLAGSDSTVAARLRAAGALLIGKTNMHEIGINPNGANVHFGAVHNPYNPACDSGGSSSGSATSVAAGLVPIAIGADGGGSIRIPAALCGVVGLKATFGRVSEHGAAPLCWSVAHLGPLAASVEDAALAYQIIAGPDSLDPNSWVQPSVSLSGWNQPGLSGVRLGIYPQWFEHAAPEVVKTCYQLADAFKAAGAQVVEVTIPELDEMRIAHATTILSEMAIPMNVHRSNRHKHGDAVRLTLILGNVFTASDYLQAQRVRTRALKNFENVFNQVDVILTPATALAAQPVPAGGLSNGWSDLGTDTEMMRFVFPSNLTGNPAISFPAGYDSRGLPVGMQAIGRHWEENLLLRVAYAAEQVVERRTPVRFHPTF